MDIQDLIAQNIGREYIPGQPTKVDAWPLVNNDSIVRMEVFDALYKAMEPMFQPHIVFAGIGKTFRRAALDISTQFTRRTGARSAFVEIRKKGALKRHQGNRPP